MVKETLAFFGAFNPPTLAHLSLAEHAMEKTGARSVLFVPSKSRYIRVDQGKGSVYGEEERLKMLRLAAERRPWMAVSDIEIRQEQQPRTYDTLCRLRAEGIEASLLMGSDKLKELEHGWLHVQKIAEEFGIVVLSRGGDACGDLIRKSAFLTSIAPRITVLDTPGETKNISSTLVREKVERLLDMQRELCAMVPEEILPLLWGIQKEESK